MAESEHEITFRRIRDEDVPNLVRWQSDDEVAMWWDQQNEPRDLLIQRWAEKATGATDGVDRYVITVDGHDIGEIQDYALDDFPEYEHEIGIRNAVGIDILIGEPDWRNRGVGTAVLREFINRVVFARPGITASVIDPEPRNARAIRCYEKVGFQHIRTYHSSVDNVDVYLMRLEKPGD